MPFMGTEQEQELIQAIKDDIELLEVIAGKVQTVHALNAISFLVTELRKQIGSKEGPESR